MERCPQNPVLASLTSAVLGHILKQWKYLINSNSKAA